MEKPIIFSAPMVQAILDGRKTQTRRVLKPQPPEDDPPIGVPGKYNPVKVGKDGEEYPGPEIYGIWGEEWGQKIKYQPGDLLWVKETWNWVAEPDHQNPSGCVYKADGGDVDEVLTEARAWRNSIFMPRWASRITLKVTGTRIDRLQEITEEDAWAEGPEGVVENPIERLSPVYAFNYAWDRIHKKKPENQWKSNPWVVVIEFERSG